MKVQIFITSTTPEYLDHIRLTPQAADQISMLQVGDEIQLKEELNPDNFSNSGVEFMINKSNSLSDLIIELFEEGSVDSSEAMKHLSALKDMKTFIESFKPIP